MLFALAGRQMTTHIFTLSQLVRGRKNRNQRTYAFFLDLQKAYDTVWRDGLLYVLWQKGIRGKLWHYIRDFYCSSKRRVHYNRAAPEQVLLHRHGCCPERYPVVYPV
jgi:hypothetical protein